jgi:hypothetical protein
MQVTIPRWPAAMRDFHWCPSLKGHSQRDGVATALSPASAQVTPRTPALSPVPGWRPYQVNGHRWASRSLWRRISTATTRRPHRPYTRVTAGDGKSPSCIYTTKLSGSWKLQRGPRARLDETGLLQGGKRPRPPVHHLSWTRTAPFPASARTRKPLHRTQLLGRPGELGP